MDKERQTRILEALAQNEEKVSALYQAYAGKFPDRRDFWEGLAIDETAHASWIKGLFESIDNNTLFFDENRFSLQAIRTFTDYLEEKLRYTGQKDISFVEALSTALDIEDALIENKWFEFFETDSAKAKNYIQRLREALTVHRAKIAEALAGIRR